jgi:hypothetical protein
VRTRAIDSGANFGKTIFSVAAGSSLELAAVPEASLLALLSPYGLILLSVRKFADRWISSKAYYRPRRSK